MNLWGSWHNRHERDLIRKCGKWGVCMCGGVGVGVGGSDLGGSEHQPAWCPEAKQPSPKKKKSVVPANNTGLTFLAL